MDRGDLEPGHRLHANISAGCEHCYAERFRGTPGHPFEAGLDLAPQPERLDPSYRRLPAGNRRSRYLHPTAEP